MNFEHKHFLQNEMNTEYKVIKPQQNYLLVMPLPNLCRAILYSLLPVLYPNIGTRAPSNPLQTFKTVHAVIDFLLTN